MAPWQSEKLFHNGDDYFSDLLLAIGLAKHSIGFETYIFNFDQLGQRVLRALGAAVKRQVHVTLKVDGIGSLPWLSQLTAETERLNIKLQIYHPLPSLVKPFSFFRRLGRFNNRDHRKTCVIDSTLAFVGGLNVDACHLREFYGDKAWRDSGIRVEGPDVAMLGTAFNGSLVKTNDSLLKRRKNYLELKKSIRLAKKRIWITTPYFNPPPFLVFNLCRAAQRGVEVSLLLGHEQDHFLLRWITTYHYAQLLKNGVRIYEFKAAILHAKTKIIDDWMTIGSSNQNYRSYFYDLEADIVLSSSAAKENLQQQFLKDLELSHKLDLNHWKQRSFVHMAIEKILSIFHGWI